jgi:hypothetical protein
MIGLSKYKKLLGEDAKAMSDDDIRQLRDAQYQFAHLAFEKWKTERIGADTLVENQL